MKYTPNDLSKILDVSANTIRRYDQMGYLSSEKEDNGYRIFDHGDLEKLMYISKYRKMGFGHKDIEELLHLDIEQALIEFQKQKEALELQIKELSAMTHLLKDDILLMKRVGELKDSVVEKNCSAVHYIVYQKNGELCLDNGVREALHQFVRECYEFEYMYLFKKEDVLAGNVKWDEAIASNTIITNKYNVSVEPPVELYSSKKCLLHIAKLPIDIEDINFKSDNKLKEILYGKIYQHMETQNCQLAGDAMGIKIGYTYESGKEWQYMLMHFPIEKRE